jgi:hypothetical protein
LKTKFANTQRVLALMAELRDAADKYAAILNVDHPTWKGYGTPIRRDLETLQTFNLSQFRPLLLAALDVLEPQEIESLVRVIVVVSMRYSIIGSMGTGNMERAYSDAAVAIRDGKAKTVAKVFGLLAPIYPDDQRFEADFAVKTITKPKLARYILAGIANAAQPEQELEVVQDEKRVNLEHVMPKARSEGWASAAVDEAEYLAAVDLIGNMTLIEREANRAAGNASFERKKEEAFSKSALAITQELCTYGDWAVTQIAQRQRRMAKKAIKVWSLPY